LLDSTKEIEMKSKIKILEKVLIANIGRMGEIYTLWERYYGV
jgi:hypothetical protein